MRLFNTLLVVALAVTSGAGCADMGRDPALVTMKEPLGREQAYMTALLRGARLTIADGCLRVVPESEDISYLGIFPHGYSLVRSRGEYVVLDAQGNKWGVVNTVRDIGGGQIDNVDVLSVTNMRDCGGPFWGVNP